MVTSRSWHDPSWHDPSHPSWHDPSIYPIYKPRPRLLALDLASETLSLDLASETWILDLGHWNPESWTSDTGILNPGL